MFTHLLYNSRFWRWAGLRGWLGRPFPGWPSEVWVGEEGCWCQSPSESLCLTELTWWLHSSRWRDRLPHTRLAYPPTAGESHQDIQCHQCCFHKCADIGRRERRSGCMISLLFATIVSLFILCSWRSSLTKRLQDRVWLHVWLAGYRNTSSHETTVGPSHCANGSPLFLASSRSSCLKN